jgi:hypothetical protein
MSQVDEASELADLRVVERVDSSTSTDRGQPIEGLSIAHPKKVSKISLPRKREAKSFEGQGGE